MNSFDRDISVFCRDVKLNNGDNPDISERKATLVITLMQLLVVICYNELVWYHRTRKKKRKKKISTFIAVVECNSTLDVKTFTSGRYVFPRAILTSDTK
jgi:hypothetical protein